MMWWTGAAHAHALFSPPQHKLNAFFIFFVELSFFLHWDPNSHKSQFNRRMTPQKTSQLFSGG